MPELQGFRTLAEQIKDLEDPTPQDVDPEGFADGFQARDAADSDSEEDVDENLGREHYEAVGKSKLRKADLPELGKQYAGKKVGRDFLDDEDMGSGSGEENQFETEESDLDEVMDDAGSTDDYQALPRKHGRDAKVTNGVRERRPMEESSMGEDEASDADDWAGVSQSSSATDNDDDDEDDAEPDEAISYARKPPVANAAPTADRAQLRALMAASQKAVATTLSQAAKDDAAKGTAVKHQRQTHGSLLRTRIQLQKALIESNSLSFKLHSTTNSPDSDALASLQATEEAALTLFNNISALQQSISASTSTSQRNGTLSKRSSATLSTPSSSMATDLSTAVSALRPRHRATLNKWSQKTQPVSISSRPSKLGGPTASPPPLSSVLDGQLTGSALERHTQKTRMPRSCAPLQAAAGVVVERSTHAADDASEDEDANRGSAAHENDANDNAYDTKDIYDDADWYALLLQELIDVKAGMDTSAAVSANDVDLVKLRRENKVRRVGDKKASKGRRLRFTVHDKLQNFMAPRDVSSWSERKKDEFFAGLLGRRVKGGLREDGGSESDSDREMEGLRLFQGP